MSGFNCYPNIGSHFQNCIDMFSSCNNGASQYQAFLI